jgi:uncharacterized protein
MFIEMKKILFVTLLSILIMIPASLSAQNTTAKKNVTGSWLGSLSANGMELRVIFNLKLVEKDSLTATLDSPDQGAKDIPCGQVTLDKKKLVIQAPGINGEYSGTVTSDSTMTGTWTQNGNTLPLDLKKQGKQKN